MAGAFLYLLYRIKELVDALKQIPLSAWFWLSYLVFLLLYLGGGAEILLAPFLVFLFALIFWKKEKFSFAPYLPALFFLHLGFAVLQLLDLDPLFQRRYVQGLPENFPGGFSGHHAFFGLLMACFAFYWLLHKRWILFVLAVVALLSSRSAFALASLLMGISWALWVFGYRRYWWPINLGAAFWGGYLFLFHDSPNDFFYHNGRLDVWVLSFLAWKEKVWLGYGIGAFSQEFAQYHQGFIGPRWLEAHNELVEYIYNTGLLGLLALLPLSIFFLRKIWQTPPSAQKNLAVGLLLVIGTNAMGNFPLQIAPFAFLFLMSLAWFCEINTQ